MSKDSDKAKRVFEGILYDVYHWEQTEFDGSVKTYEKIVRKKSTVKTIAVHKGKVLIVEEEQPDWNSPGLSIPAGKMEEGEEPEFTARRELQEETGYSFSKFRLLKTVELPGKIEWSVYIFLASGEMKQGATKLEAGERITPLWLEVDEFLDLVRDGKLRYPTQIIEDYLIKGDRKTAHTLLSS